MKIAISNPGLFFSFFYVLSFATSFFLIVYFSIRQKIQLRSVLLLLTTVTFLTIIGTRLFTVPLGEWGQVFSDGFGDRYTGRLAIGGLVFGFAGLLFAQKFLGLGKPLLILYAWISPIGLGIQKIGCFFNGCCYGTPSDLPWSVQYQTGTNAHYHQFITGMIDKNAAFSNGVIPVQLIEAISFFIISFIIWRTRNLWKKNISILLFSFFLFFIFRFFVEFLRDPSVSNFGSTVYFGIRLFQWIILISGVICGLLLLVGEKYAAVIQKDKISEEPSLNALVIYVVVLSALINLFHRVLTPFELISLNLEFIPAIVLIAFYVFKSLSFARVRLATTSFFIVPLLLISQPFLQDTAKITSSVKDFYQNEVKAYKKIDFGTSLATYYSAVEYNPHDGECGTMYSEEDYKYVYRLAGAGYSTVINNDKYTTTKGINLWGGMNKEIRLSDNFEKSYFLFGVNPYIKYDRKWIGLGIGLQAGNLRMIPQKPIETTTITSGTIMSPVYPEFYGRFGRRDIIDMSYFYGFNTPSMFPVPMHELSLGSGFGHKTDFSLRFGLAASNYGSNNFISGEGLINKKTGFSLKYYFGDHGSLDINYPARILLGINYRFGFEKQ
jgi:prolipoprotein diacylglyceryltransferase